MSSTWKNLCLYWNLLPKWKRGLVAHTGSASHLLGKGTFFFFPLLHTRKSVNSLIQWLSMGWVHFQRPFCSAGHNVLLHADLLFCSWCSPDWAETAATNHYAYHKKHRDCQVHLSAYSFWYLENIHANAFLYAISYQLTEGIRATERQNLINIFPPDTPLIPARRGPAMQ